MATEQENNTQGAPEQSRRRVCELFIGGMAAVSAGMVGFPLVTFLGRPESLDLNKPLEIALDQLSPGQALYAEHRGQLLILLTGEAGPIVYSASCPHLGCNVSWDSGGAVFHCPCHGAVFDADGQVVRGPVSAPLRKIPCQIKDGKVVISMEA